MNFIHSHLSPETLKSAMHYLPLILGLGIWFFFRFLLLTISLFIMLRIQDLNFTVPAVMGSAALASVFDMIPFVGHYAAVAVLLICVLKFTQSEFIDVRFTVAVSYAVMFLLQMLIASIAPGQLTVLARTLHPRPGIQQSADAGDDSADADGDGINSTNFLASVTNRVRPVVKATNNVHTAEYSRPTPTPTPTPIPVKAVEANSSAAPVQSAPSVPSPASNATAATQVAQAPRPLGDLAAKFNLKGVLRNGQDSSAIVDTGSKTYTLMVGDSVTVDTAHGLVEIRLDQVTDKGAVLSADGQTFTLRLH